jgi:hypothetical protein
VVSQLIAVRPLGAGCGMRDRWSTGRLEAFSDGVFADNRPSLTLQPRHYPRAAATASSGGARASVVLLGSRAAASARVPEQRQLRWPPSLRGRLRNVSTAV